MQEEEETFINTRYKNVDIIYFICDYILCVCYCMSGVFSNEKGRAQRIITNTLISFWRLARILKAAGILQSLLVNLYINIQPINIQVTTVIMGFKYPNLSTLIKTPTTYMLINA